MPESGFSRTSNRALVVGLALSVGLHLLGLAWWSVRDATAEVMTRQDPAPEPTFDKSQVKLGVRRSQAVTVNWVGFESPTLHEAPESEVEQAALSPASGLEVTAEAEPAPPAEPTPETQTPAQPTASTSEPVRPEASAPVEIASPMPESTAQESPVPAAETPRPVVETKPVAEDDEATDPAETQTEPQPEAAEPQTQPAPESQSVPAGAPGQQDKRESDAASTTKPLVYRPGQPLAAEGLEITTVRPRFTVATRAMSRPKNPVIRIEFNAQGKVERAVFVREGGKIRSTGYQDVDEPLLDAIHRWMAEGDAIDRLSGDDRAVITIRVVLGAQ